jgi:hypothetical protein
MAAGIIQRLSTRICTFKLLSSFFFFLGLFGEKDIWSASARAEAQRRPSTSLSHYTSSSPREHPQGKTNTHWRDSVTAIIFAVDPTRRWPWTIMTAAAVSSNASSRLCTRVEKRSTVLLASYEIFFSIVCCVHTSFSSAWSTSTQIETSPSSPGCLISHTSNYYY